MNLQVTSSPTGDIVWVSGPLPGAVYDLTAARIWASSASWPPPAWQYWPTKAASAPVTTCTRPTGDETNPPRKAANRTHAQLRSPGERANAQLKTWHVLRKLPCCPWKAGQLAKAIHVLQAREIEG
jgi:hypothetical protein